LHPISDAVYNEYYFTMVLAEYIPGAHWLFRVKDEQCCLEVSGYDKITGILKNELLLNQNKMKKLTINKDINVFYIQAKSFPEGVMEAHQKMHSLFTFSPNRRCFGISRPENGNMIYRVAAEEIENGDLSQHNLTPFTIPKGTYLSITVKDFRKDISSIKKSFDKILVAPNIDPNGYCIEWYQGMNDVICMVKLIK